MSADGWTILASVSQAAAALGTFGTVLVAARQWSRQWRPRLRISTDTMFTVPVAGPHEHFVKVDALNIGIRPVIVSSIHYKAHRWAKVRAFVQPDFTVPWTTRLPAKIELGETALFLWRPADWETVISEILLKEFKNRPLYRYCWRWLLICEVYTSTGERFWTKLPATLVEKAKIVVAVQELPNPSAAG